MEYKIDDVAKLFETTSFTIYSYITKYPELRKTLKAKSGVLTINDAGVELLQKYMKGEGPQSTNEKDVSHPELYSEQDPNVVIKTPGKDRETSRDPDEPSEEERRPASSGGEASPAPVKTAGEKETDTESSGQKQTDNSETGQQQEQSYESMGDFQKKVSARQYSGSEMNEVTYREMKETILHLRDQIEKKDKQIEDLNRLLENNQILIKQEQLNYKALEDYLTGNKK